MISLSSLTKCLYTLCHVSCWTHGLMDISVLDSHETLEEGQRMHQPKLCEYNKDEDNSPNVLNDKNYQA